MKILENIEEISNKFREFLDKYPRNTEKKFERTFQEFRTNNLDLMKIFSAKYYYPVAVNFRKILNKLREYFEKNFR